MEDMHGGQLYQDSHECWEDYCRATSTYYTLENMPDDWDSSRELGHKMLTYYSHWLEDRNPLTTYVHNGVPQTEVNFKIAIPITERLAELRYTPGQVYYEGTIDRVTIDENGILWLCEYKTAAQIAKAHFLTDPQVTAYCVPLDTEIFTRLGWKTYDQLVIGEEVLGYNHIQDKLEWTTLSNVHTPGNFPTITINTKSLEFITTADHRWAKVVRRKGASYKNYPKTIPVLETLKEHNDSSYVVMSSTLDAPISDVTPDEASIIAWLLTDGTFTSWPSICQSYKKYAGEVQILLDKFPGSYTRIEERNGCKIWHMSFHFFRNLWQKAGLDIDLNGWEKFISALSLEARRAFCKAAIMAEGGSNNSFYQNKGRKQDIFKLAFFLCGHFPTKSKPAGNGTGFKNNGTCEVFTLGAPHKWTKTIKVSENKEKQPVWCPQTGLGTWVMRQKGQIAITGNCWAASILYKKPVGGCIYIQWKKAVPDEPLVLKNGTISLNKQQAVTYRTYYSALTKIYTDIIKAPKANIDFLNELAASEGPEFDDFISRDFIWRNEHSLQTEGVKIIMEVEEMLNPDLPLYPNPTRECKQFRCDFIDACIALDDGDDWEEIIDLYFEQQQEQRGRDPWRKLLKHQMPPKLMESLLLLEQAHQAP